MSQPVVTSLQFLMGAVYGGWEPPEDVLYILNHRADLEGTNIQSAGYLPYSGVTPQVIAILSKASVEGRFFGATEDRMGANVYQHALRQLGVPTTEDPAWMGWVTLANEALVSYGYRLLDFDGDRSLYDIGRRAFRELLIINSRPPSG